MKKYSKVIILAIMVCSIYLLNSKFGWSKYITNSDNIQVFNNLIEENYAKAVIFYILITVFCCVVLALPGVTFAILSGAVFGPIVGTLVCVFATTIGAVLSFLVGRFFLKDSLKEKIIKNKYIKKYLFDETGKNDIIILMITRLVPLFPFNLQNFAYGVMDMKLSTYSIGTFIFIIPGTAMYTFATAGIVDSNNRLLYIVAALVISVCTVLLSKYLKRKYVN